MTDKELKEVYALYTDLWKLFREYHEAQTDEEWEKLQARAHVYKRQSPPQDEISLRNE